MTVPLTIPLTVPPDITDMETVTVRLISWDDDILRECGERLCREGRDGSASVKARSSKTVSRLTGVFASMLFSEGREPERLISHYASGKPYMEGREDITVSISHCGSMAAVSLSTVCHGIDIEKKRDIRYNITKRVFSAEEKREYDLIESQEEKDGYFFTCWTRKEALIKTGALTIGTMPEVSANADTAAVNGHGYHWDTVKRGGLYISLCCRDTPCRIDIAEEGAETRLEAARLYRKFY